MGILGSTVANFSGHAKQAIAPGDLMPTFDAPPAPDVSAQVHAVFGSINRK